MSVGFAFDQLVLTLDNPTAEVEVLVAAGHALALEIDTAQLADDKGKTKSASAAVTALRGLVDDLIAKGRASVADPDEGDWTAPTEPTSIAGVRAAKVRDAAKSGAGNARPRSRRGGAAAS